MLVISQSTTCYELSLCKEEDRALTSFGVTLSLLEPYRNAGLYVTCDNFFIFLFFAKKRLQQNTTLIGTIRAHRKDVSNKIRFKKDAVFIYLSFSLHCHQRAS